MEERGHELKWAREKAPTQRRPHGARGSAHLRRHLDENFIFQPLPGDSVVPAETRMPPRAQRPPPAPLTGWLKVKDLSGLPAALGTKPIGPGDLLGWYVDTLPPCLPPRPPHTGLFPLPQTQQCRVSPQMHHVPPAPTAVLWVGSPTD